MLILYVKNVYNVIAKKINVVVKIIINVSYVNNINKYSSFYDTINILFLYILSNTIIIMIKLLLNFKIILVIIKLMIMYKLHL